MKISVPNPATTAGSFILSQDKDKDTYTETNVFNGYSYLCRHFVYFEQYIYFHLSALIFKKYY